MARMRINNEDIRDADIFETIVRHFPDIIHSVDSEGNILFTNKKACKMLGYSQEKLLSMNILDLYADEVLEKVKKGFSQLKKSGEKKVRESLLKDREGSNIPVEIRSFGIYDDNGRFLRTFSIIRDISDIKDLQASLIHAGRLAAVGEMAAGIAHDIKNPLNVLLLANEMAGQAINQMGESDPESLESIEKSLQHISKASQKILKLSEHLTNFARGMKEKYEIVDLAAVLKDSLFLTQNKIIGACVDVRNGIEKGTYITRGAPNQLEQVFVNLISNACDAMEGPEERQLSISMGACRKNGTRFWRCDISDTGTGIPPESLGEIFQSFYTTKEKGKGTGLGLSIARGIIENHEGEIEVSSERSLGTTFSVLLPAED